MRSLAAHDSRFWIYVQEFRRSVCFRRHSTKATLLRNRLAKTPRFTLRNQEGRRYKCLRRSSHGRFKADGKWHLVYELQLTNLGKWDCLLTRLDAMTGDSGAKPIASYSGAELEGMIDRPGQTVSEKAKIAPGAFAIVYMWLNFDRADEVPAKVSHRIAMKIGDYPEAITLDGVAVSTDRKPVVVVSSPLQGEDWVAANGPSNTSLHRRAFIPVNGRAYISQRFAIDWVQLYPDGKTYQGDSEDNKNYRAYGKEIHAVADGVVTQHKRWNPAEYSE